MRPDSDDLAAIVQAYEFSLLDPVSGQEVGELGNTTIGSSPAAQLALRHLDSQQGDSALAWTQNPVVGIESTRLSGPVPVGHTQASAAGLLLNGQGSTATGTLSAGIGPTARTVTVSDGTPGGITLSDNPNGNYLLTDAAGLDAADHMRAGNDTHGVLRLGAGTGVGLERGDYTGPGGTWATQARMRVDPSNNVVLEPGTASRVTLRGSPVLLLNGYASVALPGSAGPGWRSFLGMNITANCEDGDLIEFQMNIRVICLAAAGAFLGELQVYGPFGNVILGQRLVAANWVLNQDNTLSVTWQYTAALGTGFYTFATVGGATGGAWTMVAPDTWCNLKRYSIRGYQ